MSERNGGRAEQGAAIQVVLIGREGLDAVRKALEGCEDVALLARSEDIRSAGARLHQADVVLLATESAALPFDELATIREHTVSPIVLLAREPAVLADAVAADVADALVLPQPSEGLLFAIRRAAGRREAPARSASGRVVTVFSPKGGAGKSVIATNLALVLAADEGRRTLLVDLDLQFGDCETMLGVEPARTIYDLVSAPGELDPDKLAGYVTQHPRALDLLAAPTMPEEADLVPVPRLVRLFEVAASCYELVVVDTPPSLNAPTLAAVDHSDDLLLVAILDVPALKGIRRSLQALELISFPAERISLVLNRADAPVGIRRGEVEAALERRFSFALPDDRSVPLAVNRASPAVLSEPRSEFARAVRELAAALSAAARQPIAVGGA